MEIRLLKKILLENYRIWFGIFVLFSYFSFVLHILLILHILLYTVKGNTIYQTPNEILFHLDTGDDSLDVKCLRSLWKFHPIKNASVFCLEKEKHPVDSSSILPFLKNGVSAMGKFQQELQITALQKEFSCLKITECTVAFLYTFNDWFLFSTGSDVLKCFALWLIYLIPNYSILNLP